MKISSYLNGGGALWWCIVKTAVSSLIFSTKNVGFQTNKNRNVLHKQQEANCALCLKPQQYF